MTIKDCIDIVDNLKPNQYTVKDKVMWLSFIEEIIINEVLKTHEGYDGRYDIFEGYSEDKLSAALIVPSPYDRLYTAYLTMKIDETNGEIQRYNSSKTMFNSYMSEYRKYYNKTHMPLNTIGKRNIMPPEKATIGLSDAEYENIKRDLTNTLTEKLYDMTSDDKIRDIVNKFVQDNVQMLKGKDGRDGVDGEDGYTPRKNIDYFDGKPGAAFKYSDFTPEQLESLRGPEGKEGKKGDQGVRGPQGNDGYTPKKGIDYFTEADKKGMTKELESYIGEQTEVIRSDVEGIQQQINEEAHFRGYLSTNAKVQALEATPNDFAYSAESGTKWIYDAENGWQDAGIPVPDQLTPASETTPLINGIASIGTEEAYARGDHRHPTDTTRASVEDLRALDDAKADKSNTYTKNEVEGLIRPTPITIIPTTLTPNQQYNFGEVTELALAFPTIANDGDVIYATFITGETVTTLTIDTTNTCDIEFVPEANTGYEIFGKYNGNIWIVNYSEYTVSEG